MRATLKMVLPLIVSVTLVSALFAWYQVRTEKRVLQSELSRRAAILAENLQERAEPLLDHPQQAALQRLLERFDQRERLKGIAIYDTSGKALAITPDIVAAFREAPEAALRAEQKDAEEDEFVRNSHTQPSGKEDDPSLYIHVVPLHRAGEPTAALVLFHDASYIDEHLSRTLRDSLLTALVQTILITGLALILVRWMFTRPLARTATWLRTLRVNDSKNVTPPPAPPAEEMLHELHSEMTHLARDLNKARAVAEE